MVQPIEELWGDRPGSVHGGLLSDSCDQIVTSMNSPGFLSATAVGAVIATVLWLAPLSALAQNTFRGGILTALEREVQGLVESVSPSVVTIRSACKQTGTASNPGPSSLSVGSGVILDTAGRIITSARVVEDADEHWVETFDERIFPANLLGASGDVAVLQIDATGLTPARFGDAGDLEVGSFVAAIGNSYGFACGLAMGEVNGFRPDGTIQLSVGVSAGSSGGVIVDAHGFVVGLIKAKISEPYYLDIPSPAGIAGAPYVTRRIELPTSSVSLAIPIGTALRFARNISETGAGAPAYVGVYVEDLSGWHAEHFKTSEGVLVIGVVEGSPAERYGLTTGDIIRSVGADAVSSVRRFRQLIVQSRPGERMTFGILRDGRPLRVTLEMARADMPDLSGPIVSFPQSVPRPVPMLPVTRPGDGGPLTASIMAGDAAVSTSDAESDEYRDADVRLRSLERVVDSLMREIDRLRARQAP